MTRSALMRLVGLLASLAAIALFVMALPARLQELAAPCESVCAIGQAPSGGTAPGLPMETYATMLVALEGTFALLYLLVAVVIFWRRAGHPMAFFVACMLVIWGTTFPPTMVALSATDARWFWPIATARFLGAAAITLFFYIFPDGRFRPRWAVWLAVLWIGSQVPRYFTPQSPLNPDTWPPLLLAVVSAGFLGVMVALQVYRYRWVSNVTQRRQTKWVVLGIACALTGYAAVLLLMALAPGLARPGTLGYVAIVATESACVTLLPLAVGVAILRDRLYDIDLLINRTLVYGSLSVTLTILYAVSVIVLQQVVRALSGQPQRQEPLVIVISTLAIAALFQPLRRRIQRGIDRRFFRRRYNAAKTVEVFSHTLRDEVDLDQLTQHLLAVVERTMEPVHVSLWLLPRHNGEQGTHQAVWVGEPVPAESSAETAP